MIVLNTTFHVDRQVDVEFLAWLRGEFLACVGRADKCASSRVMRLMHEVAEGAVSYAVQVEFPTIEEAEAWHRGEGARLLSGLFKQFGQRVVHFSTYMEAI